MPARRAALVAFALVARVSPVCAGAWTPEEGHGEIVVTTLFDQANVAFDQAGRFTPTPQYRSLQASAFVDYGVTDWLAALLKPSLQSSSLGAPDNQRFTGLGDSEIGLQARLWRDDSAVLSEAVQARLPTSAGAANSWLPGTPHADFDFRLLLGKNVSVGPLPGFIEIQAACRLRGGPAPDEARADLTFGVYVTPRLMVLAQSFNIVSGPSDRLDFPRWSQSKAQFSLVYSLNKDWRAQAGGFTTLAGTSAYRENGGLVAFWRRF
jgi:hypothetical protein